MKRILALALVSILSTSCLAQQHPGAEEFAAKAASEYNLDQEEIILLLQNARFKQSIVDAISRPAEAKPWYDYRPIFITEKRIKGGIEFWRENEALIEQAYVRDDKKQVKEILGDATIKAFARFSIN